MWSSLSYVADPQKAVTDGAYKGRREAHTLSSEAGEDEFEVLEEHGVTPGRSWAMLGGAERGAPDSRRVCPGSSLNSTDGKGFGFLCFLPLIFNCPSLRNING